MQIRRILEWQRSSMAICIQKPPSTMTRTRNNKGPEGPCCGHFALRLVSCVSVIAAPDRKPLYRFLPSPAITKPTGSGYGWSRALGGPQPPGIRAVESRGNRKRPQIQPPPPQNVRASVSSQPRHSRIWPLLMYTDTSKRSLARFRNTAADGRKGHGSGSFLSEILIRAEVIKG